jgi:pyruvate kinase
LTLRTTIVATLGPATSTPGAIESLITAGMKVARINFSHGTHAEHLERIEAVRTIAARTEKSVACLQDLCGPKIRTGSFETPEGVLLENGAPFILTSEPVTGSSSRASVTYEHFHEDVSEGEPVLLDDGLLELVIEKVEGRDVHTRVINGGVLKPSKGVNLPGSDLTVSALTAKDRQDVIAGLEMDVDYIALSFVRTAGDILELKELLAEQGREDMPVIAKIEKPEALDNLEEILDVVEGVMVARGDLGVEMPAEEVPMYQKKIIFAAQRRGKLVITATQMLDSMIHNPRPTRAEATDVANAILDGTDAVMLSGETAVGNFPVETVSTMARIARYTETMRSHTPAIWPEDTSLLDRSSVSLAVARAACRTAKEVDARFIVTFTGSGTTARLVSHFRPEQEILALSPSGEVCRQLALPWGVTPILFSQHETLETMISEGMEILRASGRVQPGDTAVMIAGTSLLPGATDVMKVHHF